MTIGACLVQYDLRKPFRLLVMCASLIICIDDRYKVLQIKLPTAKRTIRKIKNVKQNKSDLGALYQKKTLPE
jgi:hypothetical protein